MSGGSSRTRSRDLTPGEFVGLRPGVASQLRSESFGGGPGTVAFNPEGGFAAGIGGPEQAALDRVLTPDADRVQSEAATRDFLLSRIRGDELDFTNDPAFQRILDFAGNRFLSGFNEREEANRALFSRAGQRIQDSSSFADAASRISEAKSQGLVDIGSQLIGQQFGAARNRQFDAAGQLSNIEAGRFDRQREALEAASLPRLIADLGLERGREEFARRQDNILRALGLSLEAASPTIGQFSESLQVGIL